MTNDDNTGGENKTKRKISWKVFWDLQCPFAKKSWQRLPAIKEKFGDEYEFEIHLTSLCFHAQAFPGQCGAALIERYKGKEAVLKYIDACFEAQDTFMNSALGDCRKSDVTNVFAKIAQDAGLFDDETKLTKETFVAEFNDWNKAITPAKTEHKIALSYGVFGTPKHVIDEQLIPDTESTWGPEEWAEKLKENNKRRKTTA